MSLHVIVQPARSATYPITQEHVDLSEIPRTGDWIYLPSQDTWAKVGNRAPIHLGRATEGHAVLVECLGCSPDVVDTLEDLRSQAHKS